METRITPGTTRDSDTMILTVKVSRRNTSRPRKKLKIGDKETMGTTLTTLPMPSAVFRDLIETPLISPPAKNHNNPGRQRIMVAWRRARLAVVVAEMANDTV